MKSDVVQWTGGPRGLSASCSIRLRRSQLLEGRDRLAYVLKKQRLDLVAPMALLVVHRVEVADEGGVDRLRQRDFIAFAFVAGNQAGLGEPVHVEPGRQCLRFVLCTSGLRGVASGAAAATPAALRAAWPSEVALTGAA